MPDGYDFLEPLGFYGMGRTPASLLAQNISGTMEGAKMGLWREHSLPAHRSWQLLVTERTAQIVSNTAAVALALTLPRILIFIKHILPHFLKHALPVARRVRPWFSNPFRRNPHLPDPSTQRAPDIELTPHINLPQSAYRRRMATGLISTIESSSSFEDAASRIVVNHLAMPRIQLGRSQGAIRQRLADMVLNLREDLWAFAWLSSLAVFLFVVCIVQQIIASYIIGNSVGLSNSPYCGAWTSLTWTLERPQIRNNSVLSKIQVYYSDRFLEAIGYAENCYQDDAQTGQCGLLYIKKLPYKEEHNASCPFLGDVCMLGGLSAFSLDTGYLDSSILGINEPQRCHFRLRKTCSPLVVNETYVRRVALKTGFEPSSGLEEILYLYGDAIYTRPLRENVTFSEIYPVEWQTTHFQFRAVYGQPYFGEYLPDMRFLPEFLALNSSVTIFFINAKRLKYVQLNDDPIFPALPYSISNQTFYGQTLNRSTVLGCADKWEILNPTTGEIFYPDQFPINLTILDSLGWNHSSLRNSALMIMNAIKNSRRYVTGPLIAGSRFAAQRQIILFYSAPLEREQWKVETRKMFQTHLARVQLEILSAAQGRGYNLPYANDMSWKMAPNGTGKRMFNTCGKVKFKLQGYKNINLFGLVSLLVIAFLLWFLTLQIENTVMAVWLHRMFLFPGAKYLCPVIILRSIYAIRPWRLISAAHPLSRSKKTYVAQSLQDWIQACYDQGSYVT